MLAKHKNHCTRIHLSVHKASSASTQDVGSNFVSGQVCKYGGRGGVRGRGDTGRMPLFNQGSS